MFSGVERNSLTFKEITELSQGKTLVKETPDRFYRTLIGLTIKVKKVKTCALSF